MQPDITETEQTENKVIRNIVFKYLAHWPLFLVLLLVCGTGAFLYIKYKVPVYGLKATIIITDQQKGTDDSKMIESLDAFSSKTLVDNEIEVMKSQTVAQEVVRNLNLYAPVSENGLIAHSAYLTSPIQVLAKTPDALQPAKKVDFTWQADTRQVSIDKVAYPTEKWVNTPYGILKFTANPNHQPAASHPNSFFFSLIPVNYVADDLVSGLDVSSSDKLSTVVNLSLKDEIPQRGKKILNELIGVYNKVTVNDKNVLAANTLSFVEDRLHFVVHELDSVEANLQRFKTQNRVVDIDAQGKQFLQNVGQNDQKIGDISMQLAILDQVESYVSGKEAKGGIVPSTLGVADPVLSSLLDKLYSTELEYEKLRKIAPENNPMLIALVDQINKIKPSILENIQSQRNGLRAGKTDLTATNGKYSSMLNTLPAKERELLEISRQQSIKNNIYTFLLQKREEAAISYASAVANSRVVDNAQTSRLPLSPDKLIVCIIALVVAFGSGIGYISVKDFFNANIESRAEVEKYTQATILAELVKKATKSPIVVSDDNHTLIAEQFRQLRTSLGYLGINNRKKKILITSTLSAEGKSFVAVNLALSLALANRKVAIVDMDLRKPSVTAILDMPNESGISQYLKGEAEIESIIKRSEQNENLFVLPAGPVPTNPSELLLNGKLQNLVNYLDGIFDYIIIDTPPVSPVTDACIVSPYCDATLYIIRENVTPRIFVQKLDKYNRIKSLKNMAIVLNAVSKKGFGKQEYDYYYDSSYIEEKRGFFNKKRATKTS